MDDEELLEVLRAALVERERVVVDAVRERDKVRAAIRCMDPNPDDVTAEVDGREVTISPLAAATAVSMLAATQPDKPPPQAAPEYDLAEVARVANEAIAVGGGLASARRAVRVHFKCAGQRAWRLIDQAREAGHEIADPWASAPQVSKPVIPLATWEAEAEARASVALDGDTMSGPPPEAPPRAAELNGRHFECSEDGCVFLEFATTRELTAHTIAEHQRPPTVDEKVAIEPPRPKAAADA